MPSLLALLVAPVMLLSAGSSEEAVDVPATPEIWKVSLTDSTLTGTELNEFSWEGFNHIQGTLGAGKVSIRFSDIKQIDLESVERNKAVALVHLRDGSVKKIGVDGRVMLYGKTGFGNYQIPVKDVRSIVFGSGPVLRPASAPGGAPPAGKP